MDMQIIPYEAQHREAVVRLSLDAWAPVFVSLRQVFDQPLYDEFYPDGWQVSQQQAVEAACADPEQSVWLAQDGEAIVGFVTIKLHQEGKMGEIYMIAVAPEAQGRGVGSALTSHALEWMKQAGMAIAMVETGGDPGHAPARHTYEKAGFRLFPVARYFKKL